MGKKGKKAKVPPITQVGLNTKEQINELETQVSSFAMCLSALTAIHGEAIEDDGEIIGYRYVLRLEDFQKVGGTSVFIENQADIEGAAGTVVVVNNLPTESESVNADGQAQVEEE